MRLNRTSVVTLSVVTLSVVAAAALSQFAAGSVSAAEVPVTIEFSGETSLTIEYGQYWDFSLAGDSDFFYKVYSPPGTYQVNSTGVPAGYAPTLAFYNTPGASAGSLSAPYDVAPLAVGSYTFGVSGTGSDMGDTFTAQTPTTAQLTVGKAKLGVELRVVPDPSSADASIITARFTGRFVDEYQSSFFPGAALSPAGIWKITVTDSEGEVATERSIERAAGDDVLATSFYWNEAEPGELYTASAEFTPEGASAANFAITQAGDYDFTAAESLRPVPTSTAAAEPDTSLPPATGFGLPLWLIIIVGLLIVGLGVLVTILSVRLSRPSTATTGETAV